MEPIRAVVNGATTSVIPMPKSSDRRQHVDEQPSWAAPRWTASLGFATHGSLVAGIRASQSWPMAMSDWTDDEERPDPDPTRDRPHARRERPRG